jgi:hypothetical protein
MTIWLMRLAYWIRKATNTHSEYVILIALPLKQWLHERASMLHYMYIASLVVNENWCLMINFQILIKLEFSCQIFEKYANIKFH